MAWLIRATLIRLMLSTDFCKGVTATCRGQHKENSQGSCPRQQENDTHSDQRCWLQESPGELIWAWIAFWVLMRMNCT